ncbi:MAG: N-6 DNA methylase [Acetobacteraceae bacterium]
MQHVDHRKALLKLIQQTAHRHSTWQVFSDFCELGALSISNAVDKPQLDEREKRYMEIIKRYNREEIDRFPQMLGALVLALEENPSDILGPLFHDLELHNHWKGQYFSPFPICQLMAKMTLGPKGEIEQLLAERGYVTASEPACGSGAMVIALSQAMRDEGFNPQTQLHVTATDLDARCVHMAYLQLSLLNIPAIIQHGNTLTMEEFGRWHTPAHIMGGWTWRTRRSPVNALLEPVRHATDTDVADIPEAPETAPEPTEAPKPTHAEKVLTERAKPQQLTLF